MVSQTVTIVTQEWIAMKCSSFSKILQFRALNS